MAQEKKYKNLQALSNFKAEENVEVQTLVFKPRPIQKPKKVRLFNLD